MKVRTQLTGGACEPCPGRTGGAAGGRTSALVAGASFPGLRLPAEREEDEEEEELRRRSAEVKTSARMVKSSAGRRSGSRSMMEVRTGASELHREDQLDSTAHRHDVTLPVSL